MKIAIFGGTFNPVHNEHVELVKAAIKELSLDKLFIVPTFAPPHKNVVPAPAEDRLNMLKLAFSGVDKAEISDFELKNGGKSYSYVTAEHFSGLYPEAKLYFLVGDDMLTDFKTWRFPERILDVAELAVFGRENFTADYAAEEKYFKQTFGKTFGKVLFSVCLTTHLFCQLFNFLRHHLIGIDNSGSLFSRLDKTLFIKIRQ